LSSNAKAAVGSFECRINRRQLTFKDYILDVARPEVWYGFERIVV
jgi:hypothetical protein